MMIGLFAAGFVFVEYSSTFPSLLGFRFAPPVNRMRILSVTLAVFVLTAIARNSMAPNALTEFLASVAFVLGFLADVPFSPVHLVLLMMPDTTPIAELEKIRSAAAMAYALSLVTMVVSGFVLWWRNWPHGTGAFNVWINLPMFDPTTGGDVVERLSREARINISLGFVLPFLVPAIVEIGSAYFDPTWLGEPQTMIWAATAWAFLPASLVIRGVAMLRVATLIGEKRRRSVEAEVLQTA